MFRACTVLPGAAMDSGMRTHTQIIVKHFYNGRGDSHVHLMLDILDFLGN
jgi:hypothetical protein